jgi:hypothetical protein
LIEILLAQRTHPITALRSAMDRAVLTGCLDPQVVIIDARRAATQVATVIPIGSLARYDRPSPTLNSYDDLLTAQTRSHP